MNSSLVDQHLISLIKWLSTFNLRSPHKTPEEISTGVALAESLTQISPEWFTSTWYSKIKSDVGNNWRLKVSNLKKIVDAVSEYYLECLSMSGCIKPDAQKIGEYCDTMELKKLMQLVLGCAVNCSNKQIYITQIMGLEETVQQFIMQSIQELENIVHELRPSLRASLSFDSFDAVAGSQHQVLAELQAAVDSRDHIAQRFHELNQQLLLLQEERNALQLENKSLEKKLTEFENMDESKICTGIEYSGLRKQVEALKDETFKLEISRDDYKLKVELLEKEIQELQMKQIDLQKTADEANHLKDELDALHETVDKVAKYEIAIESYKKKMEDLSNLRRQVKILEDKNVQHGLKKLEHEEDVKRANLLRNHLELCKRQLAEVHHNLDEQSDKGDKLYHKTKNLQAQLAAIQRERDRLLIERDTLRETNEELKCTQLKDVLVTKNMPWWNETIQKILNTVGNLPDLSADKAVLNSDFIPPGIKEKLVLLLHENKIIKLNVQALLEESEKRIKTILELENRLKKLTPSSDPNKVDEKLQSLRDELQRHKSERYLLFYFILVLQSTIKFSILYSNLYND